MAASEGRSSATPEQVAWLREVFTVGRRMMPFYEGDFYPLTDNRDAGFAIFFRRVNAPYHVFYRKSAK